LKRSQSNKLMVVKMVTDILADKKDLRRSHAAAAIPLITSLVFAPLAEDIMAKKFDASFAMTEADRALDTQWFSGLTNRKTTWGG